MMMKLFSFQIFLLNLLNCLYNNFNYYFHNYLNNILKTEIHKFYPKTEI